MDSPRFVGFEESVVSGVKGLACFLACQMVYELLSDINELATA
jgi:hypothetical protein